MKKLQVGLIGCGVMGRKLAQSLEEVEGAKLVRVCDVSEDAATELGRHLSVSHTTDIEAVLSEQDIEAVIIAPPPFQHRPMCVAAAQAGKHIFVEKPLAPTVEDCDAIIDAASKASIKLMVGFVCRYHAIHRQVKNMVDDGQIGRPLYVFVYRISAKLGRAHQTAWRTKRHLSGGWLMEINAHEIDFIRQIGGEVKSVFAAGDTYVHHEADFPDLTAITLKFKSGAVGLLHSSAVSAIGGYGGRIDGTEGSLEFKFRGDDAGIHHKHLRRDPAFIKLKDLPSPNPVAAELEAWAKAIASQNEPPATGSDGRAATVIAQGAYESVESGKQIELT